MITTKILPFDIIGITVRTTNHNAQAAKDIGALWQKFMTEQIIHQIPNKVSEDIYSIYTEYEGDYLQPYTTLLGCAVNSLDNIPEGLTGMSFHGGFYEKFMAKGDLEQGAVLDAWSHIWQTATDRAYTADFEIYGSRASNPLDAEVDIFISKKERTS